MCSPCRYIRLHSQNLEKGEDEIDEVEMEDETADGGEAGREQETKSRWDSHDDEHEEEHDQGKTATRELSGGGGSGGGGSRTQTPSNLREDAAEREASPSGKVLCAKPRSSVALLLMPCSRLLRALPRG